MLKSDINRDEILKMIEEIEGKLVVIKMLLNDNQVEKIEPKNITTDNVNEHSITSLTLSLNNTTKISKILNSIKDKRLLYLRNIDITTYTDFLNNNKVVLHDILQQKKFTEKKININITKTFSSIDTRLIKYPGYTDTSIDIDELEIFKECLNITDQKILNESECFNNELLEKCFTNYGLILFNLKQNIERIMSNSKSRLIYVDWSTGDNSNNHFSFYSLNKVNENTRYWVMDCRLYNLTDIIYNITVTHLVNNFKQLYYDIYSDNVFRESYNNNCQVTEFDCQQIINNLKQVLDKNKLQKIIIDTVVTYCKYTKDDKYVDVFNVKQDDVLQKRKYSIDENVSIEKMLFENI